MKRILGLLAGLALTASAGAFDFVAVGQYDQVPTKGYRTATLELSGTWVGSVVIVGSSSGANWVTLTAGAISANGFTSVSTEGYNWIRARCSAYTSGTISGLLSQGNGDAGTGTVVSMTTPTIGGSSSPYNATMSRSASGAIGGTQTAQGASITNTAVELDVSGLNAVSVQLENWGSATVNFQTQPYGSTVWKAIYGYKVNDGASNPIASDNTNDTIYFNVSGAQKFRVYCSVYASGTPKIFLGGSSGQIPEQLHANMQLNGAGIATQPYALVVAAGQFGWNAGTSTNDAMRVNTDNLTAITSTAYTTSQTPGDFTNVNARGIVFVLDMTSVGTGSVTVTLQGKDPVSGKYYTILAGAAVTTNSTNVYRVCPGCPATANVSANDVLPRTMRIITTANNANSATYSVGYMLSN